MRPGIEQDIGFRSPRDARERRFVVSGWSSSYRGARSAGMVDMASWAEVFHTQIERYLARPRVRSLVAHDLADDDFLYGAIVYDPSPIYSPTRAEPFHGLVYYAYVKSACRRWGIGNLMLQATGIDLHATWAYASSTICGRHWVAQWPHAREDALLARFPPRYTPFPSAAAAAAAGAPANTDQERT